MDIFRKLSLDEMHHAYLIVGDILVSREELHKSLLEKGIKVSGSPDTQSLVFDTLTIDIARDLALSVSKKDFGSNRKIFIIETEIITEEAQNSLLKILEEPTSGTHFFIIIPQDDLLPTLRSRLQIINMSKTVLDTKILKMKITERLELVKEITDGISDEEKTKQDAITLLNQVESELYSRGVEKEAENLRVCQETRDALYDRGTPVKMVLENLMLSI